MFGFFTSAATTAVGPGCHGSRPKDRERLFVHGAAKGDSLMKLPFDASSTQPVDPFSRRWIHVTILAGAMAGAILVSGQIQLSMLDHGHATWRILLWQIIRFGYWAAVAPWILRAGARLLRRQTRPPFWWLREGFRAAALAILRLPIEASVFFVLQPLEPVSQYTFVQSFLRGIPGLQTDFLAYGIILALGYGLAGAREARDADLRQSRLETDLARAQLATLRLQIQPHFLFNTLHSIAAQIRRQRNPQALAMVLGLSDLLRSTLDGSDRSFWPLEREMDIVEKYVELQRTRFADRLSVRYTVAEPCLAAEVPTLVLQPLVENAIRHGIAPRVSPGQLEIGARFDGEALILEVIDNGVGLDSDFDPVAQSGVGLANIRSRLERLFGSCAELTLDRRPSGGTRAQITLPAPHDHSATGDGELRQVTG